MKVKLIAIVLLCLAACEGRLESDLSAGPSGEAPVTVSTEPPDAPVERYLIKDGSLEFKTTDWKSTKQQLRTICDSLGAYTSDESLSNLSDRISYRIVIRIPTLHFETLLAQVEKLAVNLDDENIKVDDVTREFVDVSVRIKNKKEMEDRYRELLKHAKKVDEMLNIERYIADVRTDIERMEAGLKGMQDRIAFSSLEVTFYQPIVTDFGFWSKMTVSLSHGWQNLQIFIIALANVWPFIILCFLVWFYLRRRWNLKASHNMQP